MKAGPSAPGEAQGGQPRGEAPSWLVFKKRGGSVDLALSCSYEERRRADGDGGCIARSSAEPGDALQSPWKKTFIAPNSRKGWLRGESARELSVPPPLASISEPIGGSFTTRHQHGWVHMRMSRLLARWGVDDAPKVPLVPRWSSTRLVPNKEAYFEEDIDDVACCPPSPVGEDSEEGCGSDAHFRDQKLCKRCQREVEKENVRVRLRVDCEGRVHVRLQVMRARGWDSDTFAQMIPQYSSGQGLAAVPTMEKKSHKYRCDEGAGGWGSRWRRGFF
eukprot:evm.model.scf_577EXC.8 EVM.evm.TU.scf_577EXC.8   scf_577EXC:59029-62559(+)